MVPAALQMAMWMAMKVMVAASTTKKRTQKQKKKANNNKTSENAGEIILIKTYALATAKISKKCEQHGN